jgi:hypothetical protein
MGNIFTDLFSTDAADKAAADLKAAYGNASTTANNTLQGGLDTATGLYDKALVPFQTLAGNYTANKSAYDDATGVNGQAGIDRATAAFKALPGYSGGLTTGIDQVNRTAAARGDLGGGNTSADEIKFASDYDNQKYSNYLQSLLPGYNAFTGAATTGATGQAGVLGSEAAANLGVTGQQATNDYNSTVGQGQAQSQADLAPYQASSNFWGALTGLGSLALKASGIGGFAPAGAK